MSRRYYTLLLLCLVSLTLSMSATCAAVQYPSYTYSPYGKAVLAPQAYVPYAVITGDLLGVGPLREPGDVFVADDGSVYVLDTGNNRLVCLDSQWQVRSIITEFDNEGSVDRLNQPSSVFVTSDGLIYIADTRNARVVVLDECGTLVQTMSPEVDRNEGLFRDDFSFRPARIAVSPVGSVYVTDRDVYDGLIEFGPDGQFRGFVGAPRVSVSPWDLFWRKIATREQLSATALLLPTQYSSTDIDSRGMIMTVERNTIKRLNPNGSDVLVRNGLFDPSGDLEVFTETQNPNDPVADTLATYARDRTTGPGAVVAVPQPISRFADIAARQLGMYSALDSAFGRVFTYDSDGNLLYVFGGIGNSVGTFAEPVAVDSLGEKMIVVDRRLNRLTVFRPTEYANLIHRALLLYSTGRYDESAETWQKVLERNVNFSMAYRGIGKNLLRQGNAEEAMRMFTLGADRKGYSDAYSLYRQDLIARYFGLGMSALVLLVVVTYLWKRRTSRRRVSDAGDEAKTPGTDDRMNDGTDKLSDDAAHGRSRAERTRIWLLGLGDELRYALTLVAHPFDGFWELKHEKKGSVRGATVIVALVAAAYLFVCQYTGFIFNYRDLSEFSVYYEVSTILVPFALWCIVNWALTTFTDGKGTFRDIYVYSAYSLVPMVLVIVPATIASNMIRLEEGSVYYLLLALAVLWSVAMLFIGTLVTHDYSPGKTAGTGAAIVAGMVAVLLLGMVFVMVMGFLGDFVADIYAELALRI